MPTVPPSLQLALASDEAEIARLYWVRRRDGRNYFLTDWQLPLLMQIFEPPVGELSGEIRNFIPYQSPNSTAITTDTGLGSSNATFSSYFRLTGIDIADIRRGLYKDSAVNVYLCDVRQQNSPILVVSGYLAGAKNIGDELFEAEFRSIEQRLEKNIGGTVTELCPLKLGEQKCGVPAKSSTATVLTAPTRYRFTVQTPVLSFGSTANFWQFGSFYYSTLGVPGLFDISGDIAKSTYLGSDVTEITLLNSFQEDLQVGQVVTLLEGCGNTATICNARGNIINFRGFPDLPGIDKLITNA
jgi:uncharacterized phage protein (TIGR02218 family)